MEKKGKGFERPPYWRGGEREESDRPGPCLRPGGEKKRGGKEKKIRGSISTNPGWGADQQKKRRKKPGDRAGPWWWRADPKRGVRKGRKRLVGGGGGGRRRTLPLTLGSSEKEKKEKKKKKTGSRQKLWSGWLLRSGRPGKDDSARRRLRRLRSHERRKRKKKKERTAWPKRERSPHPPRTQEKERQVDSCFSNLRSLRLPEGNRAIAKGGEGEGEKEYLAGEEDDADLR